MRPVALKEDVYWVGGIDWDLRNFHGYLTQRGSTYNAYLIVDEKITLIDSVKYYMVDEMLARISKIVDPSKIDLLISNHVEMDHSGGLPELKKRLPQATIYTSPNGERGLRAHYKQEWDFHVIKPGETVSLGKRSLQFFPTPMVHWPDNMVTYCPEEKILFSNDAFGQHIASTERFDDQLALDTILFEAKKYYANIVLPYGAQVAKAIETVAPLEITMIAPSHGLIWRSRIGEIVAEYGKWCANQVEEKALIIFDTMWNSTEKMARAIADAFDKKGISVSLLNLKHNHISDIMTDVLTARYICMGSPTLNNNMLPTVASFLTYFKGLAPKKRKALAFGSYGWGGQSIGQVYEILKECQLEMMMDPIKIQYIPSSPDLLDLEDSVFKIL